MECDQYAEDLTAYLDGELSPSRAEQVRSHLGSCESCAEEVRSLQETALSVSSHVRSLEPGLETWNRVHACISTTTPAPHFPRLPGLNRWRLAMAALASTVALGLGLWGYLQHEQDQKGLEEYMARYIHDREAQDQMNRPALTNQESNPYADNPFVDVNFISVGNPFASEDR